MDEVLVVGSGAAGVGAALGLVAAGVRPRVLDVGHRPGTRPLDEGARSLGADLRGLGDVVRRPGETGIAKLDSPGFDFVTRGAREHGPVETTTFHPVQSFAAGGLANAWGAGLYRFTDEDLRGFPVAREELDPWFDRLTAEAGVTGAADDLAEAFGSAAGLGEPLRLSGNATAVLGGYRRTRRHPAREGVRLGRPRLAVRAGPEAYGGREFWEPGLDHLYTPTRTLDRLRSEDAIDYTPGVLAEAFTEDADGVLVQGTEVPGGARVTLRARRLVLAAGPVNSARLVLASRQDHVTTLPLLDNPAAMVPLLLPSRLGAGYEADAFGLTQLNVVHEDLDGDRHQGSLLEVTAPARAAFFPSFPLAARSSVRLVRELLPAMMVLQLFSPAEAADAAQLHLAETGVLRIHGTRARPRRRALAAVLRFLRRCGAWSLPALARPVPPGHAVHYAGTLPMGGAGDYATGPDGLLARTRGVYVADGATFPRLPAKNSSFAVMANAARIGEGLARR